MCVLLQTVPPTLQQATTNPPLHQRLLDTIDFWKSESESCSVMSDSLRLMDVQSMEFSRPEYWSG